MVILLDLNEVVIEQVQVSDEIILTGHTTSPTAACPWCGTASSQVQSRYLRTLRDLPSHGYPVRLILQVRRFFCRKSTCARKIFAERLPELCQPYAQRTKRLQEALCRLGLAAGGQAGAEIGSEQGIHGSRDTILRLVRRHHLPDPPQSHIVGIDDWGAARKAACVAVRTRERRILPGFLPPSAEPSLNQVRLGQCSRARKDGLKTVRGRDDC